jgi:subtilase family serine protease
MKSKILVASVAVIGLVLLSGVLNGDTAKALTPANVPIIKLAPKPPPPPPDLAFGKIWIVKAGPITLTHPPLPVTVLKKGEKYILYCQYRNNGGPLSGVWKLGYYIDGQMVWNQYWGNVAAGATQTRYFPNGYIPATLGAHTYSCRLDYDLEVKEQDETNNKTSIGFTVVQ